jgi:acyl transferase domain-containing protein/acyl carrier protein/thioesterase domain-containing protein/nucleoside-diphosphate-sugar epimerase
MVARKELTAAQAMQLIERLRAEKPVAASANGGATARPSRAVAIIGMSGRFPGASDVREFWRNLRAGRSTITEFPSDRWDADRYYHPDPLQPGKTSCKWGGFLDAIDRFDSAFFHTSPKEAQVMDTQQRLFLQEAWRALEDAGYGQAALDGANCGVFVGAGAGDYTHQMAAEGMGADGYTFMGNANAILAARISYLLNLKGPALTVDTACSSSLTAIHLACESLALGTSQMAIAGGICILNTPNFFMAGSKAGMLSPTGQCRAFDRDADGLVPGEAVGVVVLKPLDRAVADGDHIHGIIEGSAINQDGRTNGITAPSAPSQTALELAVYEQCGVSPEDIGYVEAHGTGTPLGDPIEVEALTDSFRKYTTRTGFCGIGSSKTNIGHTMSASGVVGVIKMLLALEHRELPPSLNFEHENPAIGFAKSPFRVITSLEAWPVPAKGGPRRAAVSSFGFSGTNVHLVLAEAAPVKRATAGASAHLIVLSAPTASGLQRRLADLEQWLRDRPEAALDSVAYTLLAGRTHFEHRAAVVTKDREQLLGQLAAMRKGSPIAGDGKLEAAAREYMCGSQLQWENLFSGPHPPRISLPPYPFECRSYKLGESSKPSTSQGLHPLLDAETQTDSGASFTTRFDRDMPFLRDHAVGGERILPGACFLEMALEGARRYGAGTQRFRVATATFHAPLIVREKSRTVTLEIRREASGTRFRFSLDPAGEVLCTGDLLPLEADGAQSKLDLEDLRRRSPVETDLESVYAAFRNSGVVCGPFCRGLASLRLGDREALAELRLPQGEIRSLHYYNLHPTLVDGAFQAAMALVSQTEPEAAQAVLVPYEVGSVQCDGPLAEHCYALVRRRPGAGFSFDIALLDEEGRVAARLSDFRAREFRRHAPAPKAANREDQPISFYRPAWAAQPLVASASPAAGGATLILKFAEDGGLGNALARRMEDRVVLQAVLGGQTGPLAPGVFQVDSGQQQELDRFIASLKPLGEIYFLGSPAIENRRDVSSILLRVLKSLRHRKDSAAPIRLKVITGAAHAVPPTEIPAPSMAALPGLAQTFSREAQGVRVSTVDLGRDAWESNFAWNSGAGARWIGWLLAETGERTSDVLAYRGEQRYARMLERVQLAASAQRTGFRRNAAYVIVGGAGGLGLAFARHLVERYQASVLLTGRNELGAGALQEFEQLRRLGGDVLYERADVTDRASMARVLDIARTRWGQLNGVIHAAMVLRDLPIDAMSEEAFHAVMAPKVEGSEVLADLLRDDPLDFLAFFSSANSFFGNAGQGNYAAASTFQDALGWALARQGRPVKVVNWGFWGEVGAVATPHHRQNAARHGVGAIATAEGIEAFERALQSDDVQLMPMKISLETLARLEIPAREGAVASANEFTAITTAFDAVEWHGRLLLLRYLQSQGVFQAAGERHTVASLRSTLRIAPRHEKLWSALADLLVRSRFADRDGEQLISTAGVTDTVDAPIGAGSVWAEPFVKLLDVCVSRYADILTGTVPVTDVMFPGGSMALVAPLYRENPIVEHYNKIVAAAVADRAAAASSPLRILEVGAGTGGTTAGVLEALRDSANPGEYHYTDVSPGFVQQGRNSFAAPYPFVRFQVLDIQRDPAEQGFEPGSFDVVLASNVLHATSRIEETLRHVRKLLKPGGTLILNEATRLHDFSTLTFGLTDGWWLSSDPHLRLPHSPLLDEAGWQNVLASCGFAAVEARGNEAPDASQSVLIAEADRTVFRAAAQPPAARPEAVAPSAAAHGRLESTLALETARALNLSAADIDANRRFAELGVDSIVGVELVTRINKALGVNLRTTILFDYPSVRQLSGHLLSCADTAPVVRDFLNRDSATSTVDDLFRASAPAPVAAEVPARKGAQHIAITGIAGRFPGAPDVQSYWRNLRSGTCSIAEVPRERWDVSEYYDPTPGTPGKSPCKWGGFLSDIDCFDPLFFRMSGAEAEFTDPQQRLFVEQAWKALEDAGYSDRWLDQRKCGVFVGVGAGDYVYNMIAQGMPAEPYAFLGNGVSVLASRISYLLNLRGPAVAIDTACSSSLMALHLACQSIASGDCELALTGGVFLSTTSSFHYLTGNLGMLSPSGKCRAFDDGADGFVPGEAVGAIVLRPLDAALRDGDTIYGVILATGANQDGHTNGMTAPSSVSQAELESEVYRKAGIDPRTITLVEAHGTGTRLGDPIEVEGLRQSFGRQPVETGFCALGSVKTNIGHAGPAAGIAGIIKLLLAMRHAEIPPSLNFERPNRSIDFSNGPFYVASELREWQRPLGAPRRAAISAFGLSGTNVHVVLQEAPALPVRHLPRRTAYVAPLSAQTPEALSARLAGLAEWLHGEGATHEPGDIAYTLAAGRSHFTVRKAVVFHDAADLARKLRAAGPEHDDPELLALARRYEGGAEIDWASLYADRGFRRISLPGYPFARDRYWLPVARAAARPAEVAPVHYFQRAWKEHAAQPGESPGRVLVFGGAEAQLAELRRAMPGCDIGSALVHQPDDYERAIAGLRSEGVASYGVVVLADHSALDAYFHIARAIVKTFPSESVRVAICTEPGSPSEAAAGFSKAIAMVGRNIGWSTLQCDSHAMADIADELRLSPSRDGVEVRRVHGKREVKHSLPVTLPGAPEKAFKRGGIYWIAGGTGALGHLLARYLVTSYDARVVITGRSTPQRAPGDGVQFIAADISDMAQMRAAAEQIRRAHGRIDGVIHAAGKIDSGLVHEKPFSAIREVLSPKVSGAVILDRVTEADRLDFFVLFSSLSALAGDFGQCDYAVANRFLETFSEWRNGETAAGRRYGATLAVHWPLWAEGGMHFSRDVEAEYLALAGMSALETAAGWSALEWCLNSGLDAVAVAAGDLTRIRQMLGEAPLVRPVVPAAVSTAATADVVSAVREATARIVKLPATRLAPEACFSNFGLDSLNMKNLADALSRDYEIALSPTAFFHHQTIASLAEHLCQEYPQAVAARHAAPAPTATATTPTPSEIVETPRPEAPPAGDAIAIIGASGRFPQSRDLNEFWEHLNQGDDLITEIPADRWDWHDQAGCRWGGFMPDLDKFDAAFFHISPREAAFMDPQHRIFLETVWATIEDAGYRPSSLAGRRIGVYAGCQFNEYMGLIGDAGPAGAQAALGNTHTMLANRVSFWFDFHGPSEAIDTACSSALVAVHRAVQSLRNGDCEMAIAGGVSAILSPETLMLSGQLGMLSPDGRSKAFDKSANGYVKGEGVGAVLLKPLARALADGDFIHGVIRATAENHGGRANFLTAPNPQAQTDLLVDAYTRAGIDVRTVTCIEAHGTGTELGDPIEVDALRRAFAILMPPDDDTAPRPAYCGLASVKSNIGHLEPAAGIAGLLKLILAMRHKRLPRTLHVAEVNPYLRLQDSPFYLLLEARDWDAPAPRRAGVSAFGFGGSNAHVVLEEAPEQAVRSGAAFGPEIVPVSAKTEEALRASVERLCVFLATAPESAWSDLVFTLQTGREALDVRLAVEARTPAELADRLRAWLGGDDTAGVYCGGASKSGNPLDVFDTGEERAAFLQTEIAKGKLSKVARLWAGGMDIDWSLLHAGSERRRISLPTYPFARTRHWFDQNPRVQPIATPVAAPATVAAPAAPVVTPVPVAATDENEIREKLIHLFSDALYLPADSIDVDASFTDLGLDSILAVELAKKMHDEFGAAIKATRLYDYPTISALASYLASAPDAEPGPEAETAPEPVLVATPPPVQPAPPPPPAPSRPDVKNALIELLADSLYLDPSQIDEHASFIDLGLDSILAVEVAKKLQDLFQVDLRATRLYDHSTVHDLAAYLTSALAEQPEPSAPLPAAVAVPPPPPASLSHEPLRELLAQILSVKQGELDDSLDLLELGLDAISAQNLSSKIRDRFGVSIAGPKLLSFASLADLARALERPPEPDPDPVAAPAPAAIVETRPAADTSAIAIVGMSGRFPGARNLEEFWANLAGGVDSVTEVPAERWSIDELYDPDPAALLKTYCRRGGFLSDIDQFDPLFFQISPQEAEWIDPQQRIFLEESWLALEDAGYTDAQLSSANCAVFVGVSPGDYTQHVDPQSAAASQFSIGNANAILAARIAYFLNLKGPAVSLDTACSSSLVAVHLACQALRAGECEMALAGGISVMTGPNMFQLGSQGRMLSATGACKAFDNSADGFVPAEGAAAIVLKRLTDALRDGDRIHAVITGAGTNQDGKTNGITAPSAQSQAALELSVYRRFGLDPATISYVEAHGTGTKLGDPIEVDALTTAFRHFTDRKRFCAIGSVKSNIGHSLPAAGMAGLLKTVLAFERCQIPPSLHCERENEHIDFANSPFFVNRELQPWVPESGIRRAAVSSFGFSGTNAHIVMEEAPRVSLPPIPDAIGPRAFCFSAKTPEALRRRIADLESWLVTDGGQSRLDDLSYTLNVRRTAFRQRVAVVADSRKELLQKLRLLEETGEAPGVFRSSAPKLGVAGSPVASMAQAWVRGETVDWAAAFGGQQVHLISLPGYPFVRRRCWAERLAIAEAAPAPALAPENPLLDECRPGFTEARGRKLFHPTHELLRDHSVQGQPILPGVGYLEIARAAIAAAETGRPLVELRDIIWQAPFKVDGGERELIVKLQPNGVGLRFEFVSEDAQAQSHAHGEAHFGDPSAGQRSSSDIALLLASCPREFPAERIYQFFGEMGLAYGPSFRCLEWIRAGESDAVGKIVPPPGNGYEIHPGVLDAALQTLIGFAMGQAAGSEPMLPFALHRYQVHAPIDGPCYAHASIPGGTQAAPSGALRFDVHIIDSEGRLLVSMEGFSVRRLKREGADPDSAQLVFLEPAWQASPLPASPVVDRHGSILIFRGAEDFGLSASLVKAHAGATVIPILLGKEYRPGRPNEAMQVNCRSEVDYERALAAVGAVSRIYFLGGLSSRQLLHPDEIDEFQETSALALFRLIKAIGRGGQLEISASAPTNVEARSSAEADLLLLECLACIGMLAALRPGGLFLPGERYERAGLQARLQFIPAYDRLLDVLLEMLRRLGVLEIEGGAIRVTDAMERAAVRGLMVDWRDRATRMALRNPGLQPQIALMLECLDHYLPILRGEVPATNVFFPGGSMRLVEAIYRGPGLGDYFPGIFADAIREQVEALAKSRPGQPVRILEIGAGTGGATVHILPQLAETGAPLEFVYTDISLGFKNHGENLFGARFPFTRFQVLDIEKDPASQGLAPGSFDIVYAANVLHATRNIGRTLANVRSLTRPGGVVFLNEATASRDLATLTFGLLEGWWRFEDPESRLPNSPLLDVPKWRRALERAGFTLSAAFGEPGLQRPEEFSQSILVCPVAASVQVQTDDPAKATGTRPAPKSMAETLRLLAAGELTEAGKIDMASTGPQLVVVTNNVHRVRDAETAHPQAGSLAGLARVFANEFPGMPVSAVDLDAGDLAGAADATARVLAGEIGEEKFSEIACRGGERFVRTLRPAVEEPRTPAPLRDRGVYVILGGMGGLGLTFARHLAATQHARLLLVGRSPLTEEKQRSLDELNGLGGEAIYAAADAGNLEQMQRLRAELLARWGRINGVIHSAFLLRDKTLLRMDEARFREAFAPKVRGTSVALWTFRDDALDWVALFSSGISFTGGPGQANYAAGSTFQDALGLCWNSAGRWPVKVFNWGYWGQTGAVASEQYRQRVAALGVASIGAAEGIDAFHRLLAGSRPQTGIFKVASAALRAPAPKTAGAPPPGVRAAAPPNRTAVSSALTEQAIAYARGVISTVLKVRGDDLDDAVPFEDYGVDSLVSINIVTELEASFGPLSKTLLFEQNTIVKLAGFLAAEYPARIEGMLPKAAPPGQPAAPAFPNVIFPVRETGSAQKSFWVHSVVGEMNWAVRLAHHMGPQWPVYGFHALGLQNGKPPYARLEDMASTYVRALRQIQPHGPYVLGGFSFGGSVALEMARQLEDLGERISWLVLLDAYAPDSQALQSLLQFNWDGLLPQVIANLLVKQWKGSAKLKPEALPKDDFETQIRIAARHVVSVCNTPQTEQEVAAVMAASAGIANLHAKLQMDYHAGPCGAVEHAVVIRNRFGFVGPNNELGLPMTRVNDSEPDHGWTKWLPAAPLIFEVDADHFSLGLEPAIEIVGRRVAELIGSTSTNGAGGNGHDRRQRIFDVVKGHVLRILPDVPDDAITLEVRLKDLGANSLDRVEVATCAMEELELSVPRTRLAGVDSLQSLVEVLLAGLAEGHNGC